MVERSKTKKQKFQEETRRLKEIVAESYCSVRNKGSTAYLLRKQSVRFLRE